jgi:hypothetical protein
MSESKKIADKDNYDYLRGWLDGHIQEPISEEDYPEGFKNYDEVYDRMWELKDAENKNSKPIQSFNDLTESDVIEFLKCLKPRREAIIYKTTENGLVEASIEDIKEWAKELIKH